MKLSRMVAPIALIVFIVILLIAIRPAAVGYAEPLADPTATMLETDKPPDPTPGPGVTETLEPTKTPPVIETTKPPDPTPPPGVTETLQPTKTDEPEITETASPAPSATNTETVQSSETPSQTPTVGDTATPTSSPVSSLTPTSTQTPTGGLTPTPTNTLPATSTSTPTVTASHTPNTPTVTATATVLPSVTPGTPAATGTRPPVDIPTDTPTPTSTTNTGDTATPGPTITPTEPVVVFVNSPTGTLKLQEGYELSGAANIVGMMRFPTLRQRIPISLVTISGDRIVHHAENVAGKVSDDDVGMHQRGAPWLSKLRVGDPVWRGDGPHDIKYIVAYIVTVKGHNQFWMDYWLDHYATITTCTDGLYRWSDSLVFLLKPIDERMR